VPNLRIDDNAYGGDIDLVVISKHITLLTKLDILGKLHLELRERKIDLVIYPDFSKPFARIAANQGILL
jgi:hypothetical protein